MPHASFYNSSILCPSLQYITHGALAFYLSQQMSWNTMHSFDLEETAHIPIIPYIAELSATYYKMTNSKCTRNRVPATAF